MEACKLKMTKRKTKTGPQALFASSNKVTVSIDGGARGNPGPAAIGVVLEYDGTKKRYGEAIGKATNNVAEYTALVFALKKIKALFGKEKARELTVEVHSDSELLVRQMTGIYKIEEPSLRELFVDIWNLRLDYKSVTFTHVPREKNKEADRLVNEALDRS